MAAFRADFGSGMMTIAVVSLLALAGCDTVPSSHKPETAVYVHHVYKSDPPPPVQRSPLDDPNSILARRSVYFTVNSSEIRPIDRTLLQAHADFMRANPSARIRIEGNADDRGENSFNRQLGLRRAESVRSFMRQAGVSDSALETLSYGKENPVDTAITEDARARNRRVDIRYVAR